MESQMKRCWSCKEEKPATFDYFTAYFTRQTHERRVSTFCKVCAKKKTKELYWKDPEVSRAKNRVYRTTRDREKFLSKMREWYLAHKDSLDRQTLRDNARRWQQNHHEEYLASQRRSYVKHRAKWIERAHARRMRFLSADGQFTAKDILRMYESQAGECFYCFVPLQESYHVDHQMPLSRGGSNWPDNLCLACRSCNLRKGKQTAGEFVSKTFPYSLAGVSA